MRTYDAKLVEKAINTIRMLSVDGVEKANSGHPDTPMALAQNAFEFSARHLRYDATAPDWADRDRFVARHLRAWLASGTVDDMEINGIAHLFVTTGDFARARAFYAQLLPFLGMKPVLDGEGFYYCVGGRTAFGLRPASPEHAGERFDQGRVGLHHVCFRARAREDVDAAPAFVRELGARIVHPPEEGSWAPGYYSVLFEDPDGARLEVNLVPGRGLLREKR